jgi:hypothetical protein
MDAYHAKTEANHEELIAAMKGLKPGQMSAKKRWRPFQKDGCNSRRNSLRWNMRRSLRKMPQWKLAEHRISSMEIRIWP